jgi:hypothetical protein
MNKELSEIEEYHKVLSKLSLTKSVANSQCLQELRRYGIKINEKVISYSINRLLQEKIREFVRKRSSDEESEALKHMLSCLEKYCFDLQSIKWVEFTFQSASYKKEKILIDSSRHLRIICAELIKNKNASNNMAE